MREAVSVMDNAMRDPDAYIEADLDFHLALAEAAPNPLILSLIDSIVVLCCVNSAFASSRSRAVLREDSIIIRGFSKRSSSVILRAHEKPCPPVCGR